MAVEKNEKLQALAQRLLERLADQVESGELDYGTIKQICATMKDLKELVQPAGKSGGITVTLGEAAEKFSE